MNIGIDPSKVVITKLHLDPDRKSLLERKNRANAAKGASQKGKVAEKEVGQASLD